MLFILGDTTVVGNGTASIRFDTNTSSIVMNYTDLNNDTREVHFYIYTGELRDMVFENRSESFPVDVNYVDVDYVKTYHVKIVSYREIGNYTYMADITPSNSGGGIDAMFREFGGIFGRI
jgi:hypothetical protein